MSADVMFVVGLIGISLLFVAVMAVRSRRQQAAAAPGNTDPGLLSSRPIDGGVSPAASFGRGS